MRSIFNLASKASGAGSQQGGLPLKSIFIAAIIAAACSGVAMAGELKQDQTVKAQVMSDSEMDKVTAGVEPANPGQGLLTARSAQGSTTVCPFGCPAGN